MNNSIELLDRLTEHVWNFYLLLDMFCYQTRVKEPFYVILKNRSVRFINKGRR